MSKVVFVGDEPSTKNTNKNVAFIGTPSFSRIAKWLNVIELTKIKLINSHTKKDLKQTLDLSVSGYKVVALGNNASKRLKKLGIDHYKLPHPSPKNRLLNNKRFEQEQLVQCKRWLGL